MKKERSPEAPWAWINVNGKKFPLGYKVVTKKNFSLGLRKNPTPLHFPERKWVKIPDAELIYSRADAGGIWSARDRSGALTLKKYMLEQYGKRTKVYLAALFNPIYMNSYRIKSQGVMLLEELR